jgi:hypothetical protein
MAPPATAKVMANVGRGLVSRSRETQLEKMQISILQEPVASARYRERLNSDHRRLRNGGAMTRTTTRDHYAKHDELEE